MIVIEWFYIVSWSVPSLIAYFPNPTAANIPRCLKSSYQPLYPFSSSKVIASVGHTSTQDSQPIHSSACTRTALPSSISNTSTGHTSTHSSQPIHFLMSTITINDPEAEAVGKTNAAVQHKSVDLINFLLLMYIKSSNSFIISRILANKLVSLHCNRWNT